MHEAVPPKSASGVDFYDSVLAIADGVAVKEALAPVLPAELTTILAHPETFEDGWKRVPRLRLRQK
jgi:hypothetical protein